MSSKPQQARKGGYPQRVQRPLPKSSYKFHSNKIQFSPQRSRVVGKMRPISSSAFVAGNFLFVYKNCSQLQNSSSSPKQTLIDQEKKETVEIKEEENKPKTENNQIKTDNDEFTTVIPAEKLQNELNDVLFSHCIHPNSGAEFSLLFSVIVHQPEDYICPICLYTPVAPRVTHCGHIFCADCIAQHISMCDQPFCPVCYENLFSNNMESIQLVRTDLRLYPKIKTFLNSNSNSNNTESTESTHFLFQKIKRSRKNCVCFQEDEQNSLYLPKASQRSSQYCHFMLADNAYSKALLEKEKKDLQNQIDIFKEYKDELKLSFINEIYEGVINEKVPDDDGPLFFLQESKPNEFYHFYQDSYGRLVFLDQMSVKMLSMQFGSVIEAPNQIEVDALKLSTISVDQRFRDRYHSLGHLPAGADVTFVLADLKKIVSDDILSAFSEQIEQRLKVDDDEIDSPENEPLTEADFPAIFAQKQTNDTQPKEAKKGGWANIKIESQPPPQKNKLTLDDDFPSFSSAFPKKKSAWGSPKSQPPPSAPVISKNDFPSLSEPKKRPK